MLFHVPQVQRNHMECALALMSVTDLDVVDEEGRTALMMAAMFDYTDILQVLLANNSNPLAYDKTGSTALHMAASAGHVECVQLLIAVRLTQLVDACVRMSTIHVTSYRLPRT